MKRISLWPLKLEIKGGEEWLYNNIEYPEQARKASIEGRVIVQFFISKKGK